MTDVKENFAANSDNELSEGVSESQVTHFAWVCGVPSNHHRPRVPVGQRVLFTGVLENQLTVKPLS